MTLTRFSFALAALFSTVTLADTVALSPTEKAARRFPQPVRVGDLIGRQVLQPVPAQHVLGCVTSIRRNPTGSIDAVIRAGGLFGFGTRLVGVPVEAVALLGEHVALMDITPETLRDLPDADEKSGIAIGPEEHIRVGLAKPFH